jgi:hypothetical protein
MPRYGIAPYRGGSHGLLSWLSVIVGFTGNRAAPQRRQRFSLSGVPLPQRVQRTSFMWRAIATPSLAALISFWPSLLMVSPFADSPDCCRSLTLAIRATTIAVTVCEAFTRLAYPF